MPGHERWCKDTHCSHCYAFGRRIADTWPIYREREVEHTVMRSGKIIKFTHLELVQVATGVRTIG